MSLLVGIDVGSTTVKAVAVADPDGGVVWRDYQRHETRQPEKVLEFLHRMETEIGLPAGKCRIFMTGSGGSRLAPSIGAKFVQEVAAVSLAVETLHPEANSVIELGGQDAKIIVYRPDPQTGRKTKVASMNDKCASGTGAIMDKIAAKLGIRPDAFGDQPYSGITRHQVAGKCGVFAETDINGLQKRGIPAHELMASLFDAIVQQNLTVLARGQTLRPVVLLLGGPNTFVRGLREAWQHNIPLTWPERGVSLPGGTRMEEVIFTPEDGEYFGALGAVEFGRREEQTVGCYAGTEALKRYLDVGRREERARCGQPGLVRSDAEREAFTRAFRPRPFQPTSFTPGQTVGGAIGLDGGSTSTKAVLLDADGRVLCKAYRLSNGNPIEDAIEILGRLQTAVQSSGATLDVLGIATTGYAKDTLRDVFQADVALVETVAHARAALAFYEDPHVIVDVGGQDIKLIVLREGRVRDFRLNTQCSAGNGYYLQATAEQFGVPVERYAATAFSAEVMPLFGYGCAVFLQSDIVNFQRQGWRAAEILAGLAAVLPQNVFLYVAGIPNLATLGRRFILQGGTQNNLAAVKAEVDFIRSHFHSAGGPPQIVVHEHCGEAGAIGAGLEALRLWREGRKSTFIGLDAAQRITYRTTRGEETRCRFCTNACMRTFIDLRLTGEDDDVHPPRERRLIVAGCEKGSVEDVSAMRSIKAGLDAIVADTPNLVAVAARDVWKPQHPQVAADPISARALTRRGRARRALMNTRGTLRIGIPRVLNLYALAPLFSAYLESLGVDADNIVYSDVTSGELYRAGSSRGAIDPCFPSKVVVAHVHNLIYVKHARKRLDCIFLPMFDGLRSPLVNVSGSNACPTAAATPETVKAAFTRDGDLFERFGIRYINPMVNLSDTPLFARQMLAAWGSVLGLSERENAQAVEAGLTALDAYEGDLRRRGREVIDRLEPERRLGIVVLGRPYHHDPGLNHGILEELQKLGYPILSQSTLPLDDDLLERLFGDDVRAGVITHPLDVTDVWKNAFSASTNQKVWAAKFTARHPNLVALELSSFKCGHDAPIYTVIERIIEHSGTPYFAFKDIDENRPAASIKIRVETIDYFLKQYRDTMFRRDEPKPIRLRACGRESVPATVMS
jgi:activator of 2-hydroxyglutaryl-CoA dehydratase/predicted nucleotide-binding protein (sugar kinase/HSP70/actin superfamily)